MLATHNLQPAGIVNLEAQDPDAEEEELESPSNALGRFEDAGRRFIQRAQASSVDPIEAEPFERPQRPPTPPRPKRQKVATKITPRDIDPKAVPPSPKAASETFPRFPRDFFSLRGESKEV